MPDSTHKRRSVDLHIEGAVATVTIRNPSKRNAFTRDMCIKLKSTMEELETSAGIRLVVLRGAAGHFSAGVAIEQLHSVLFDRTRDGENIDHFSAADVAITNLTKPSVAVVEGFCMGGGWQLASACDFILASSDAQFAITPAKIGILYPRPGVERLVRLVGPDKAKYILMTAKNYSAQDAQTLGLLADVISSETFEDDVQDILETLLNRSRFSQEKLKRLIDLVDADSETANKAWADNWEDMLQGPDMEIGITAFQNQRRPEFVWTPEEVH